MLGCPVELLPKMHTLDLGSYPSGSDVSRFTAIAVAFLTSTRTPGGDQYGAAFT
jgi:hypothetical protein